MSIFVGVSFISKCADCQLVCDGFLPKNRRHIFHRAILSFSNVMARKKMIRCSRSSRTVASTDFAFVDAECIVSAFRFNDKAGASPALLKEHSRAQALPQTSSCVCFSLLRKQLRAGVSNPRFKQYPENMPLYLWRSEA